MSAPKYPVSREKFLRNSTYAAGGIVIAPRSVPGRGFIAPGNELNITGIGTAGRADAGEIKTFSGRKKLLWNEEKMEIVNFVPANQFVKRNYRNF